MITWKYNQHSGDRYIQTMLNCKCGWLPSTFWEFHWMAFWTTAEAHNDATIHPFSISTHWDPGRVASPSQGHTETNQTHNHPHSEGQNIFWTVGCITQGEHKTSTQKGPSWESNQEPSCCEATMLTTRVNNLSKSSWCFLTLWSCNYIFKWGQNLPKCTLNLHFMPMHFYYIFSK